LNNLSGRVAIAVMAKTPRAGRSKTRLCPPLDPDQAARMAAAFLRDVTDNIANAAAELPIDGWVAYAPAGDEHLFDGMLAPGTQLLLADGVGEDASDVVGFGRCLLQATRKLLDMGYAGACVLNADSPTLPTAHLTDLADKLLGGTDAVLGADQTRARAADLRITLAELPVWYDVDDRAALSRLLTELAHDPTLAPSTRATIAQLGIAQLGIT